LKDGTKETDPGTFAGVAKPPATAAELKPNPYLLPLGVDTWVPDVLTVETTPANAHKAVIEWESDDDEIVEIVWIEHSPYLRGKKVGEVTVTGTMLEENRKITTNVKVIIPVITEKVIYDMQNDPLLANIASTSAGVINPGVHPFLARASMSSGGTSTVDTASTPKTITVAGRGGRTQSLQFSFRNMDVKEGHSYRFEAAGTLGNAPGALARLVHGTGSGNADLDTFTTTAGGAFTLSATRTAAQINADIIAPINGLYAIGTGQDNGEQNSTFVHNVLRIIEICPGNCTECEADPGTVVNYLLNLDFNDAAKYPPASTLLAASAARWTKHIPSGWWGHNGNNAGMGGNNMVRVIPNTQHTDILGDNILETRTTGGATESRSVHIDFDSPIVRNTGLYGMTFHFSATLPTWHNIAMFFSNAQSGATSGAAGILDTVKGANVSTAGGNISPSRHYGSFVVQPGDRSAPTVRALTNSTPSGADNEVTTTAIRGITHAANITPWYTVHAVINTDNDRVIWYVGDIEDAEDFDDVLSGLVTENIAEGILEWGTGGNSELRSIGFSHGNTTDIWMRLAHVKIFDIESDAPDKWPTPAISLNLITERLTGFIADAAYTINDISVSIDSDGTIPLQAAWLDSDISIVRTGLSFTADSDPQILAIPEKHGTPAIAINFANETFINFVAGATYTINNTVTTSAASLAIIPEWMDTNVSIVRNGDIIPDSEPQSLPVPQRPNVPIGLGATDTFGGLFNGTITGVTTAMQYKRETATAWINIAGSTVNGLAGGTYHVRVAPTATAFASLPSTSLVIESSAPPNVIAEWKFREITDTDLLPTETRNSPPGTSSVTVTPSGSIGVRSVAATGGDKAADATFNKARGDNTSTSSGHYGTAGRQDIFLNTFNNMAVVYGWVHNPDNYAYLKFSTKGYEDLLISYDIGRGTSGSTPQWLVIQYSLNGTTWEVLPGSAVTITNNVVISRAVTLPLALYDQDEVWLRWFYSSQTGEPHPPGNSGSANLGGAATRSGYVEFDNIVIGGKLPEQQDTPTASVDYFNERFTGLEGNSAYTVNGAVRVADVFGRIDIIEAWIDTTVNLVKTSVNPAFNSAPQPIILPPRPIAPSVDFIWSETTRTGTLTDVNSTMEYRQAPNPAWVPITDTTVPDLMPGIFQVRVRATAGSFAGVATGNIEIGPTDTIVDNDSFEATNIRLISGLQLGERAAEGSPVLGISALIPPTLSIPQRETRKVATPEVYVRNPATSKAVIWSTSNPGVARVSEDGDIRALRTGTAIIRAAAAADITFFTEMLVTVTPIATDPDVEFTVTNPYQAVNWDTWEQFKAAHHTHSWASDGHHSTAEHLAEHYRQGFHIVAVTDHDRLQSSQAWVPNASTGSGGPGYGFTNVAPTQAQVNQMLAGGQLIAAPTLPAFGPPPGTHAHFTTSGNPSGEIQTSVPARADGRGMLVMPNTNEHSGLRFEAMRHYSTSGHHVNSFYTDVIQGHSDFSSGNVDGIFRALGRIAEAGGIAQINHPGRYTGSEYPVPMSQAIAIANRPANYMPYAQLFMEHPVAFGMEIINKFDTESQADRILWDNILSVTMPEGRAVWGTSNDDAHSNGAVGFSYNMMVMPELTNEALRTSMEDGTFFAFSRVDREYGIYAPGISIWDWDGGSARNLSPADLEKKARIDPVRDLPVPEVKRITVQGSTITIDAAMSGSGAAIDAGSNTYIDWYADGVKIHTGKTIDLIEYQTMIYSYVRATIVTPNGVMYVQPFGVERQTTSHVSIDYSAMDDGFIGFETSFTTIMPANEPIHILNLPLSVPPTENWGSQQGWRYSGSFVNPPGFPGLAAADLRYLVMEFAQPMGDFTIYVQCNHWGADCFNSRGRLISPQGTSVIVDMREGFEQYGTTEHCVLDSSFDLLINPGGRSFDSFIANIDRAFFTNTLDIPQVDEELVGTKDVAVLNDIVSFSSAGFGDLKLRYSYESFDPLLGSVRLQYSTDGGFIWNNLRQSDGVVDLTRVKSGTKTIILPVDTYNQPSLLFRWVPLEVVTPISTHDLILFGGDSIAYEVEHLSVPSFKARVDRAFRSGSELYYYEAAVNTWFEISQTATAANIRTEREPLFNYVVCKCREDD
jgi:hypothetical protein